jgi:hypothetical protein
MSSRDTRVHSAYSRYMSRTHSILATASLCIAASACGAAVSHNPVRAKIATDAPRGQVQVRNYDGDVLPAYALADAGVYIEIECRNGQVYQIVNRSHDWYSATNQSTSGGYDLVSLSGICDRVRSSRLDYYHLH